MTMVAMSVEVVRLREDEWQSYRAIRLDALQDSPAAIGSTLAEEQAFRESTWRRRLAESATFVARVGGQDTTKPVGLVLFFRDPEEATYELVSMWVRPAARGSKVADALVRAVIGEVADIGADAVHLWVTEPNTAARRLYERRGFSYTGRQIPLPSNPSLTELLMVRYV